MAVELAERVQRVRLLLLTLNDPYPTPRGALEPDSGPAASRYVPCETCRARGEVRRRGGWILCLVCDGRGEKRREREPEWDAYVELPLVDAVSLPVVTVARPRLPAEVEERTFGWERARRAYDRHGSYQQLRRQLDWLRREDEQRYRLVRAVLVDHEQRELTSEMHRQMQLGVFMIARRMKHVRVPPWLIERTTAEEQRETIAELAASGMSAAVIARRLGITKEAARRKMKRNGVESAPAGIPRGAM